MVQEFLFRLPDSWFRVQNFEFRIQRRLRLHAINMDPARPETLQKYDSSGVTWRFTVLICQLLLYSEPTTVILIG